VSKNRANSDTGFGTHRKDSFAQHHDEKADSDGDDEGVLSG